MLIFEYEAFQIKAHLQVFVLIKYIFPDMWPKFIFEFFIQKLSDVRT